MELEIRFNKLKFQIIFKIGLIDGMNIFIVFYDVPVSWGGFYVPNTNWKSTSISGIVTMHSAMLSTL